MLRNTVDHIWGTQHEKLWPSSSSSPQAHNERWCKDRLAKGVVGGFLQEERRGCCSARGVHIPAAWANLGTAHHPTGHSGEGKSSRGEIHIAIWTNTNCNLDKYKLQFRRLHFAIYAAFTFQTCLIWAAATTADPTTGHSGEGGRGNPVSDHGGESSRRAQNQNCVIATTSDLTLSSPSSKWMPP